MAKKFCEVTSSMVREREGGKKCIVQFCLLVILGMWHKFGRNPHNAIPTYISWTECCPFHPLKSAFPDSSIKIFEVFGQYVVLPIPHSLSISQLGQYVGPDKSENDIISLS